MIEAGFAAMMEGLAALSAATSLTAALGMVWSYFISSLPTMLLKMAAQYVIQLAITELAGVNPELAMILSLVSMVAISAWEPGVSFGSVPGTAPLGSDGNTGGTALGTPGTLTDPGTVNPQGLHY